MALAAKGEGAVAPAVGGAERADLVEAGREDSEPAQLDAYGTAHACMGTPVCLCCQVYRARTGRVHASTRASGGVYYLELLQESKCWQRSVCCVQLLPVE
eukprot:1161403-Pelagomonas_calceolata.AAC.2